MCHRLCAMHRATRRAWGRQCWSSVSALGSRHHRDSQTGVTGAIVMSPPLFLPHGDTEGSHQPEDILSPALLEGPKGVLQVGGWLLLLPTQQQLQPRGCLESNHLQIPQCPNGGRWHECARLGLGELLSQPEACAVSPCYKQAQKDHLPLVAQPALGQCNATPHSWLGRSLEMSSSCLQRKQPRHHFCSW